MPLVNLMVAVAVVPEVQEAVTGGFGVEPSLNTSTAVKGTVLPTAAVGLSGESLSEKGTAGPTVSVKGVLGGKVLKVALMSVDPTAMLCATPVLAMVATPAAEECHVT
jgi:hypothetical protein